MVETTATSDTRRSTVVVPSTHPARRAVRKVLPLVISYTVLSITALISIIPFLWMVSTSLKSDGQIFSWPPKLIPNPAEWSNYRQVFEQVPFERYFLNTAFYSSMVMLGNCSSAAWPATPSPDSRFRGVTRSSCSTWER